MSLRFNLISCSLMLWACFSQSALGQFPPVVTGTPAIPTSNPGGTSPTATPATTGSRGASTTTGAAAATPSTAAQSFIGGNASQGFIGGGLQGTQQNANRQFQAIQNTQSQFGSQGQQTGTPRSVRTTMSIGFSFPTATIAQSSGRLAGANSLSFARFTSSRPEFSGITVAMTSQGVAVLTGSTVSTESKRLAANLMRLQPGVRKVQNQIAVSQ